MRKRKEQSGRNQPRFISLRFEHPIIITVRTIIGRGQAPPNSSVFTTSSSNNDAPPDKRFPMMFNIDTSHDNGK